MRDLLAVLDALTGRRVAENREPAAGDRAELGERLAMFREAARTRVESLRSELASAEAFAARLGEVLDEPAIPAAGRMR